MADKSKGGRPKDSKGTKEQRMMPVTIEMGIGRHIWVSKN